MSSITISISEEIENVLDKRAKKNLFSLTEQVEDIIRRSCVNSLNKKTTTSINCDDQLVGVFSRSQRGRKKKVKKKK